MGCVIRNFLHAHTLSHVFYSKQLKSTFVVSHEGAKIWVVYIKFLSKSKHTTGTTTMSKNAPVLPERIAIKAWDDNPKSFKVIAIDTSKPLRSTQTQDKILSAFLVDSHEYEILKMKVYNKIRFPNCEVANYKGDQEDYWVCAGGEVLLDMDFSPADAILWRHQTKHMMTSQECEARDFYKTDAYGMMFEKEYGVRIEYAKRESFLQRL